MQKSRLKSLPNLWRNRSVLLASLCAATCANNLDAQTPTLPQSSSQIQLNQAPIEPEVQTPFNSTLEIRVARRPWLSERKKTPPRPAPDTRPLPGPAQYPNSPYAQPGTQTPPSLSNFGPQPPVDPWDSRTAPNRPQVAPYADLQQPQLPRPQQLAPHPSNQPNQSLQPMVIIERDPRQQTPLRMEVSRPQPPQYGGGQQPTYGTQQPTYGAQQPNYGAPQQQPYAGSQQPVYGAPAQQQPYANNIAPHQNAPQPGAPQVYGNGQYPIDARQRGPLPQGNPAPPAATAPTDDQYVLPELETGRPWPPGPDPEPQPSTSPRSIRQFLEEATARSRQAREPQQEIADSFEPAENRRSQPEPVELEPNELKPIRPADVAEATPDDVELTPVEREPSSPAMEHREREREFVNRAVPSEQESMPEASAPVDEIAEASKPLVPLDYAGYPRTTIRLNETVARMKNPIRQCLSHYYSQFEKVQGRSNWGMLHAIMVYGIDTKVQAGDETYSSIGWIAGNNICRGQRLVEEKNGKLVIKTGIGLQGHQGQMLAIFSLCDVPEDYPIYAGDVRYSLRDVVDGEMAACRNDVELTFTLIGLSHYLDTESIWLSDDGETWTFERLLRAELSKPIVGAACGGTHRLMGFAHALRERRGEGRPIIGQWRRAEAFTQDFIEYTFQLQNSDGSMSTHWFEGREDNGDMDRKVQTTGHMVEWLLTVLPDSDLQDPRLVKAVQYLLVAMSNNRTHEWSIGPKGHALRSLAMFYERVYKSGPAWRSQRMARGSGESR